MKNVHVECKPDELLISKLGFTRKTIIHHSGKSRVFNKLNKITDQVAMVDEDPGSAKTNYEKSLRLIKEGERLKYFTDKSGNKIVILAGKLEDWIIKACHQQNIKLEKYKLSEKPNELHEIINQKLPNFEKLIDELINKKNPAILKLKQFLLN